MTVRGARRNGRAEGGGLREGGQSAYRFIRPESENVKGQCVSDGGQITAVKTAVLM